MLNENQQDYQYLKEYNGKQIKFSFTSLEKEHSIDPSSQLPTFNLYIRGQVFEGVDQAPISETNFADMKLYKEFKLFLEAYFLGKLDTSIENSSELPEDV